MYSRDCGVVHSTSAVYTRIIINDTSPEIYLPCWFRDACLGIIWDSPRHWIISWQFFTFCEICFGFFFGLLQWLLVLLFESVETPTRDMEMERKCWTKRNCNPILCFLEQIFIFACVCWNYCLQICSLFCTLKDHYLHTYDYINALLRMSTLKAHTHCCVRLAKLSEDSSGLLSWKH